MLAFQRLEAFDPVAGDVGLVAHLLQQAQGDLLVDDIVVAEQDPERQPLGQRPVEFGAGGLPHRMAWPWHQK